MLFATSALVAIETAHPADSIHSIAIDSSGARAIGPDSAVKLASPSFSPGSDPIAAAWNRALSDSSDSYGSRSTQPAGDSEAQAPWRRENTTSSLTVFDKFPQNPVLPIGARGSLDAGHAEYPSVVVAGDRLWMFYAAYGARHRWEIAAAVSDDGIHWTKHGVVLAPETRAGAWDSSTVAFPCVLYSESAAPDERFRMWYAGKYRNFYRGIGLATSPDGLEWRRQGRVLATGGLGEWDREQIADPVVIEVSGGYRMYYCGADVTDNLFSVGVAVSADGRHWVKMTENPLYRLGERGGIYTIDVVADEGGFLLFASAPNGDHEYEVHAVPSDDGFFFDPEARRLVLAPARDHTWDHALVYGMDVLPWGENLYMWFNGLYTPDVTRGGQVGLARAARSSLAALLGRR